MQLQTSSHQFVFTAIVQISFTTLLFLSSLTNSSLTILCTSKMYNKTLCDKFRGDSVSFLSFQFFFFFQFPEILVEQHEVLLLQLIREHLLPIFYHPSQFTTIPRQSVFFNFTCGKTIRKI